MKIFNKITITAISEVMFLAFFIIVPVIILNSSWWWFFIPFIFIIICDIIIGIIVISIRLSKRKTPEVMKINIKGEKEKAIYEAKYDGDNPDNFKILKQKVVHIGEKGSEKTPILLLEGKGTELNQVRVVIINMNNTKKRTILINPTSSNEINEAIRLIADNPPEESIKEETTTGIDAFGRPVTTTRTIRPNSAESIRKEEEKKAEEMNSM